MTHRERVEATLRGDPVDRLAMWYGADPETTSNVARCLGLRDEEEAVLKELGVDFRTVRPKYIGPELKTYPDGTFDTIWGIRRGGAYYGQGLNHPLSDARTVSDVESYAWPSVDAWDAKSMREEARQLSRDYTVMGGAWTPFFHDVAELFGMETMFVRMFDSPEIVEAVIDKCASFYLELSERMFREMAEYIDIFFFGNDFGSQAGLICSPNMWRRFFGPTMKSLTDLGHKYGMKSALHSCGSIHEILPDLIEMGLDIVNPIQTTAAGMSPDDLCREFGNDIVFFGGIDVQHILTDGSVEDVRQEVKRVSDVFSNGRGYILAPAHDYLLPEVPSENIVALYRTGLEASRGTQ